MEVKKTRRKLLTDPERMRAECGVCKEVGNVGNLIWQKYPLKDQDGKELYGCSYAVYFCSENCKALFNPL
jgi:hypothetical protein